MWKNSHARERDACFGAQFVKKRQHERKKRQLDADLARGVHGRVTVKIQQGNEQRARKNAAAPRQSHGRTPQSLSQRDWQKIGAGKEQGGNRQHNQKRFCALILSGCEEQDEIGNKEKRHGAGRRS